MNSGRNVEASRLAFEIAFEGETERVLRRHSGVICWTKSPEKSPVIRTEDNGTFCFVQTHSKRFIVTCEHVWRGYEKFKESEPLACLWLTLCANDSACSPSFPLRIPEPTCIGDDRSLDLATLSFGAIEDLEAWRFYRFVQSRTTSVAEGDIVMFIGFPGEYIRRGSSSWTLPYIRYGRTVSQTSQTLFQLHSPSDKLHLLDRSGREIPAETISGISGAPVFRLNPRLQLDLVGFVLGALSCGMTRSHATISCEGGEAGYEMSDGDIYATYARFVRPDGGIDRP